MLELESENRFRFEVHRRTSFKVLNVGNAESATFVTTTAGLTNVISRVTGGNPSRINGLVSLRSTNAAPNFFFINSAGVVFGQGAQINVPAGFHASTANYCSRRARRLQPRTAALVDLVQPLEASLQSPPTYSRSPNAPVAVPRIIPSRDPPVQYVLALYTR